MITRIEVITLGETGESVSEFIEHRAARRDLAALGELPGVVQDLGAEERAVLLVLARRLLQGQQAYGKLSLATDGRDWRRERAEELADALVYGAIAEVAGMVR